MRGENAEVARRIWESWERGDFSAGRDRFDAQIEFLLDVGPDRIAGNGSEAMAQIWREQLRQWDHWHTGPIAEIVEAGDDVVVVGPVHGRGKASHVNVEIKAAAAAFTFRGGRIVQLVVTDSREKTSKATSGAP